MKWNIALTTKKGSSEVKLDFQNKEVELSISEEFIEKATDALFSTILDKIFGKDE